MDKIVKKIAAKIAQFPGDVTAWPVNVKVDAKLDGSI